MYKTILVVDDEESICQSLKGILVDEGYEIFIAKSGEESLKIIEEELPDLVLLDICMPDMDGYELYSRAKEYDENLPIIMMTGFGYDPDHVVVKSRKAGLQDVIFKPFDIKKLTDKIKKRILGE